MSDRGREEDGYARVARLVRSVPHGPDRVDKILTLLHGEGWKERAAAARVAGPTALDRTVQTYLAVMGRDRVRLQQLEERVARIERHLGLEPLYKSR
jgi:hypothetical protein